MLPVTVVLLAWNGAEYLEACLDSVFGQGYSPLEVIVVDNGSTDNSAAIAERRGPGLRLLRNGRNLGYSAGNNVGLAAASGEVLVLLNQDTVMQPGCLAALADTFSDAQVGIVGCKIFYPDGRTLQHAGASIRPGDAFALHRGQHELDDGKYDTVQDMDYVTGAALALHRRVLECLGPLDGAYYPAYYEDIDYCYRARRAGFRVLYQPRAVVRHHESASTARQPYARTAAFHRHRLRFVLSHWTPSEWQAFVAAEQSATSETFWIDDAVARARAYLGALVALPGLAGQRVTDQTLGGPLAAGEQKWMAEQLAALRQQALERVRDLINAAHPLVDLPPAPDGLARGAAQSGARALRWSELEQRLAVLRADGVLREPAVGSTRPLLGSWIVKFRRLWNSIAVRWYILPVLQQQTAVNQQVAQALLDVVMALREENLAAAVDATLWQVLAADQSTLTQALSSQNADPEAARPAR